jgi:hypothetical protein
LFLKRESSRTTDILDAVHFQQTEQVYKDPRGRMRVVTGTVVIYEFDGVVIRDRL